MGVGLWTANGALLLPSRRKTAAVKCLGGEGSSIKDVMWENKIKSSERRGTWRTVSEIQTIFFSTN